MSFNQTGIVFKLAWRNIFRNKRRTVLTLIAISIGLWSSIALASFARGVSTQLARDAIQILTGHVQLHSKGYINDPVIEHNFSENKESIAKIIKKHGITASSSRVRVPAVIRSEREAFGVTLLGINPPEEKGLSFIGSASIEGSMITSETEGGIIIGRKLLTMLQTAVGKKIVILAQDTNNKIAERGFVIKGVFSEDLEANEKSFVFVGRKVAQDMLGLGNNISEVSLLGQDKENLKALVEDLRGTLPDLEVHTWKDLAPLVVSILRMQTGILNFWFLVVIITISFGLINTIFMAVFERIREIGMIQALGMKPRLIILQVLFEYLTLLGIGAIFGNILGLATAQAMSGGIDISKFSKGAGMFGLRSTVYPVVLNSDLLSLNILIVIMGVLAGFYPAWKASRYSPVEAMRKV